MRNSSCAFTSLRGITAAGAASAAGTARSADPEIALELRDLFDAILNELPFVVARHFEALLVAIHHALAELGRIKVPPWRRLVLRDKVLVAQTDKGGDAARYQELVQSFHSLAVCGHSVVHFQSPEPNESVPG